MEIRNTREGNLCEGNPKDPEGKENVGTNDKVAWSLEDMDGGAGDSGERNMQENTLILRLRKTEIQMCSIIKQSNLIGGGTDYFLIETEARSTRENSRRGLQTLPNPRLERSQALVGSYSHCFAKWTRHSHQFAF